MKKIILMCVLASTFYACTFTPKTTCESLVDQRDHLVRYDNASDKMKVLQLTDSMLIQCHCGQVIKDSTIVN